MSDLQIYINTIKTQIPLIDITKYSHNIISLILICISENYSIIEANKVVRDLKLDTLGWEEFILD